MLEAVRRLPSKQDALPSRQAPSRPSSPALSRDSWVSGNTSSVKGIEASTGMAQAAERSPSVFGRARRYAEGAAELAKDVGVYLLDRLHDGPTSTVAPGPKKTPGVPVPAPVPTGAGASLDLLTFNTFGKPSVLGDDEEARMKAIGPKLSRHGIVALQETFTRHAELLPELSQLPHYHRVENGGWFKLNAGLFTLSKYPIKEMAYMPFEQAKDFDRFARKGVLFTRVEVPGIGDVDIYNTHYQSRAEHSDVRMHDNDVLAKAVRSKDVGNPTFLLGDFNMTPQSTEYQDLVTRLNLRDAFAVKPPAGSDATADPSNTYRPDHRAPKRIDHLFYVENPDWNITVDSVEVAMKELVDGRHLSDHFGVHGRVTVTPRGASQ